jgi:histidinol dehydrogenase
VDAFVNAGAVFVGGHSPVSLGDYLAGSNLLHVGQCGAIVGDDLLRTQEGGCRQAGRVARLTPREALPAHGEAVVARFAQDGAR